MGEKEKILGRIFNGGFGYFLGLQNIKIFKKLTGYVPAVVLPLLATPLKTRFLEIFLLWQTSIEVESMKAMPVIAPLV